MVPTQVARVAEFALLPAKRRAAVCERLNVWPLKNVALGTTVMLPLRTMLRGKVQVGQRVDLGLKWGGGIYL